MLVAGVAAVLIVFLRDTGDRAAVQSPVSTLPAQTVGTEKNVPLPPAARKVAATFIQTAVKREHLADAWSITGPGIRQSLTYKQWLSGNIPVVPVTDTILGATYKTDYSHPNEVQFEVALIVKPDARSNAQSTGSAKIFFMKVIRKGSKGKWLVDSWIPRVPVAIPSAPGR